MTGCIQAWVCGITNSRWFRLNERDYIINTSVAGPFVNDVVIAFYASSLSTHPLAIQNFILTSHHPHCIQLYTLYVMPGFPSVAFVLACTQSLRHKYYILATNTDGLVARGLTAHRRKPWGCRRCISIIQSTGSRVIITACIQPGASPLLSRIDRGCMHKRCLIENVISLPKSAV